MLKQAWNAYRGWAKCARDLQAATGRWNLAALVCVVIAPTCGAATTLFPETAAGPSAWGPNLASAAAIAAAVGVFLGRDIIGIGRGGDWIHARATAEGLKSECFRFAAKLDPYSGPDSDAANAFMERYDELAKQATDKGLVRADDPVPASGDDREPSASMDKDWYRAKRIGGQIDYYKKARALNEAMADRLWRVAFVAGLAAVAFGALGAWVQRFAPWIGAMTTIVVSIAIYSLLQPRRYLVASYAAMESHLQRILARDEAAPMSLSDLVRITEDLLENEYKGWLPQMLVTRPAAPAAPPKPSASGG